MTATHTLHGPVDLPSLRTPTPRCAPCGAILPTLCLLILTLLCCQPASASDDFIATRAAQRQQRQEVAAGAAHDRADRATRAAKAIGDLIDLAATTRAKGQDEALGNLLDGLALLDPAQEKPLRARLHALPPLPDPVPAAQQRKWDSTLDTKRENLLAPTRKMAQRAIDLGVPDLAGELLRQYLTFYPESAVVHRNMGLTLFHGRWYGPRSLEMAQQGLSWDDRIGWVVESAAKRYAKGDYYDLDRKAWTTLDQADAAHATLAQPWTVLTEHLELHGTAHLTDLVDAGNRLELFYAQIFSAYAPFFTGTGTKADIRLVFGMTDHPRLVVNIERDGDGYRAALPPGIDAGWSDGMYVGNAQPASYFSAGSTEVLYHEFTHQILGVFNGRDHAPAWLVEGIAVYTQAPVISNGNLTLGHCEHNQHIQLFFAQHRDHKALTLNQLFALSDSATWSAAADPIANYAAAGAFAQFAMEGADRRHRADFIDFLRDSYNGETENHPVWEYLGMKQQALTDEFETWCGQQQAGGG